MLMACKDADKDAPKATVPAAAPTAAELDARCELLGKTCADQDKHVEKIVEGCRQAVKQQVEKRCTAQAVVVSDCYAKELCGRADKVWAFSDLPVLAARSGKCVAEQAAVDACVAR